MNKRIIAPWKPLVVAFGAILLAVTLVVLTAPEPSLPFAADRKADLVLATSTPWPRVSSHLIKPAVTALLVNEGQRITTPTLEPTPTVVRTPFPVVATAAPAPLPRQPVAIDPPQATPQPPPPPPPTAVPTPTPIPGGYRPDITEQLYTLLNNERTSRGIAAVGRNSSLVGSAEYYARLIFLRDPYDLNHWLDGGPGDRAWARGYCCGAGEIIVESEGSAQGMVELWMSSAPHKGVILDQQYVVNGIACYDGPVIGDDGNLHHPIVCVGDFGSG